MKRTFAVALAAGVLLLGACDRQPAESSGRPDHGGAPVVTHGTAATESTNTSTSTTAGGTSAGGQPAPNGADDVDSMLGDVDKQLNSDSQPTKDSD
jgi:hypothetical protein